MITWILFMKVQRQAAFLADWHFHTQSHIFHNQIRQDSSGGQKGLGSASDLRWQEDDNSSKIWSETTKYVSNLMICT